ncbi:MAG: 7TM diverse intracellular signaling domain-containing protein [Nitrospinota bacterium]
MLHTVHAGDIITTLDKPVQINTGKFKQGDNPIWASKDMDDSSWEDVFLPDDWNISRKYYQGIGWYRFKLKVSEGLKGESLGILLKRSNMVHALYFNGNLIGTSGTFEPPARTWNYPATYNINPNTIQYGKENIIAIKLFGFKNSLSGLHSPLLITAPEKAEILFNRAMWLRVYSSQIFCFILLTISAYHFIFFYKRPRDQVSLYFALCSLLWAINLSNNFLKYIPMPYLIWEKIIFSSIAISGHIFLVFAHRYVGKKSRNIELLNVVIGSIGFLSLSIATRNNFIFISNCWFLFSLSILIYIIYIFIRSFLEGNKDCSILIGGFVLGALLGIHDLLIHAGILSASRPHLLGFGVPIILLGIAFSMANRFARLSNQYERLNIELEEIADQKAKKLFETERMLVLEKERTRMSKEIHDGVGSSLIKISTSIERTITMIDDNFAITQIKERIIRVMGSARYCLSEIKSIIWSLESEQKSIISIAEWIEDYCKDQCEIGDIDFSYSYHTGNYDEHIPDQRIQTTISRVIRICMSNIIKHSKAKNVKIDFGVKQDISELSIIDDGIGFDTQKVNHGRGLKNLHEMITDLSGKIAICSGIEEIGTKVEIKFSTNSG